MLSESRQKVGQFVEWRKHVNAAALDSASNVAARVLSIYPRYISSPDSYEEHYGREMLEKAKAIHEIVGHNPELWIEDTETNRSLATKYLEENVELLGALASIIQQPSPPAQMLAEELDEIERARRLRKTANDGELGIPGPGDPVQRAIDLRLAGVAFSGGGIRSATFNLGILQALADAGLLSHIDYLSTVSGGGYIGSWLESWMQHRADSEVEQELAPARAPASQTEPDPIQFLRSYSNYLTPEKGMFSADTWTMLMIWTRNTFLNLIVLVFTGTCMLLVPRLIRRLSSAASYNSLNYEMFRDVPTSPLSLVALLVLLVATVFIGRNLSNLDDESETTTAWFKRQHWVLLLIVLPTLAAGMVASFCLWDYLSDKRYVEAVPSFPWTDAKLIVPAVFVFFLLLATQVFGDFWQCFLRDKSQRLLAKFSSAPLL